MKIAIAILNRNMPELADELYENLQGIEADFFLLENGSDCDKYSKYANLLVAESNGVSWGVNFLLNTCLDRDYDYIWLNYNDARFEQPKKFLQWSVNEMERNQDVGIVTGWWPNTWGMNCQKNTPDRLVSFFDPISFVISKDALQTINTFNKNLQPFWDSSNYPAHFNILGPALALYGSGKTIITTRDFKVTEIREPAQRNSKLARGFDDEVWRNDIGPKLSGEWLDKFFIGFRESNLNNKQKRDAVIRHISAISKIDDPVERLEKARIIINKAYK